MEDQITHETEGSEGEAWKRNALIVGGAVGLVVGVGAAYLLAQRAEKEGETPELSAGEGVKLGVMIFGLLRSISQL
jgi:hypothetical protein